MQNSQLVIPGRLERPSYGLGKGGTPNLEPYIRDRIANPSHGVASLPVLSQFDWDPIGSSASEASP